MILLDSGPCIEGSVLHCAGVTNTTETLLHQCGNSSVWLKNSSQKQKIRNLKRFFRKSFSCKYFVFIFCFLFLCLTPLGFKENISEVNGQFRDTLLINGCDCGSFHGEAETVGEWGRALYLGDQLGSMSFVYERTIAHSLCLYKCVNAMPVLGQRVSCQRTQNVKKN